MPPLLRPPSSLCRAPETLPRRHAEAEGGELGSPPRRLPQRRTRKGARRAQRRRRPRRRRRAARGGHGTHQSVVAVREGVQNLVHDSVGQEGGHRQLHFAAEKPGAGGALARGAGRRGDRGSCEQERGPPEVSLLHHQTHRQRAASACPPGLCPSKLTARRQKWKHLEKDRRDGNHMPREAGNNPPIDRNEKTQAGEASPVWWESSLVARPGLLLWTRVPARWRPPDGPRHLPRRATSLRAQSHTRGCPVCHEQVSPRCSVSVSPVLTSRSRPDSPGRVSRLVERRPGFEPRSGCKRFFFKGAQTPHRGWQFH